MNVTQLLPIGFLSHRGTNGPLDHLGFGVALRRVQRSTYAIDGLQYRAFEWSSGKSTVSSSAPGA